jgi:hypothetical protein
MALYARVAADILWEVVSPSAFVRPALGLGHGRAWLASRGNFPSLQAGQVSSSAR